MKYEFILYLVFLLQIRVNSVNPTVVLTDMGRRVWSAEDVVREFKKKIPLGRFAGILCTKDIKAL